MREFIFVGLVSAVLFSLHIDFVWEDSRFDDFYFLFEFSDPYFLFLLFFVYL